MYALLREALRATRKVAVATFVMRGRQHLCVVASMNDVLMLLTLRFASEVLPPAALAAAAGKTGGLSAAELTMAKQLVEQMSGEWRPDAFKDTYRADLMRTIREKIRKKQTHALSKDSEPADERPKAQVIDLMEALKKSLRNRGADKGSTASVHKPVKAPPAKAPPARATAKARRRA